MSSPALKLDEGSQFFFFVVAVGERKGVYLTSTEQLRERKHTLNTPSARSFVTNYSSFFTGHANTFLVKNKQRWFISNKSNCSTNHWQPLPLEDKAKAGKHRRVISLMKLKVKFHMRLGAFKQAIRSEGISIVRWEIFQLLPSIWAPGSHARPGGQCGTLWWWTTCSQRKWQCMLLSKRLLLFNNQN